MYNKIRRGQGPSLFAPANPILNIMASSNKSTEQRYKITPEMRARYLSVYWCEPEDSYQPRSELPQVIINRRYIYMLHRTCKWQLILRSVH